MMAHDDAEFVIAVILACGVLGVAAVAIDALLVRLGLVDDEGWFRFLD
jgi:hypothetical protein